MLRVLISSLTAIFIVSCVDSADRVPKIKTPSSEETTPLKRGENPFLKYYHPVKIDVLPSALQYKLPIEPDGALKYKRIFPSIENDEALDQLAKNGFVVTVPGADYTQFTSFYKRLTQNEVPVFITSDTVLHLYHILFDNLLKKIEEDHFFSDLKYITRTMVDTFDEKYKSDMSGGTRLSKMTSAYRRNVAYFSVAAKLLDDTFQVPDYVEEIVNQELELIDKHSGFQISPLFSYREDYSQYIPRGHYTQSDRLKNYFKAMMWYGRMTFLLKGKTAKIRDALVTEDVAMMQTRQALMITEELSSNKELVDKWKRIYKVTAFFVGFSDDLDPEDYSNALANLPIAGIAGSLYSDKIIHELRKELATLPSPAIYGGTGNIAVARPITEEDLNGALGSTMGMRFFGQRFVPDSYVTGKLVGIAYTGKEDPFTRVNTPIGPIRGFPRGLDVMSVMGSVRARTILKTIGDTDYVNYDKISDKLKQEFATLSDEDWHWNLYWGWLSALRTLLKPASSGYPTFMTTDAWEDRYIEEALASWSQLRHDTILYAKSSYGMVGSAMPEEEPQPKGYVEPAIELYTELRTLNVMMLEGLDDFKLLDRSWLDRLERVNRLIDRLIEISKNELAGRALTDKEQEFIQEFGEDLTFAIGDLKPKSTTTALIADVHTDPNTNQVLEVGTGYLNIIWVACPIGDDRYFICAGPVLSFYEFKRPMSDRLTDGKWQDIIRDNSAPEMDIFNKPKVGNN